MLHQPSKPNPLKKLIAALAMTLGLTPQVIGQGLPLTPSSAVAPFSGMSADATAVPAMPGASAALPSRTTLSTPNSRASLTMAAPRSDVEAPQTKPAAVLESASPPPARKPPAPSQFQRFVQESTGQLLANFGSELFDNPQAYTADAASPAPADYVLGPGDEVRIQIWGAVDYAGSHTLDRNSQLNLPKVGTFSLAGTQVKDLEAAVRRQVATVFTNVSLNASLGRLRGITVYVVGQAKQPGTYNLNSLSTLVNAVFASGGPNASGSMRNIRLQRGGQTVATLDLYDFIAKGDKSKDARLQPGDVITIPPAGPRVALTGATDHAAIFEIRPGNALQDVLSLVGGVPALARPQKALVETLRPDNARGPREVVEVALAGNGLAQPLRDGDIITLLPISTAFSNAVTLAGTVAQPLRHRWFSGMRVQDLIPEREALITDDYYRRKNQVVQYAGRTRDVNSVTNNVRSLVDEINWDYAVIERLNRDDLRTELIPFNLGKALAAKDSVHNLTLQPGDVITIMSSADLRLPMARKARLVRVEGEVVAPGVYNALPGETLPQLLARVGGLTPQAYLFGAEFTRESVRAQQQQNMDMLVRRLESQLQSAAATQTANLTGERAAQAQALQQAQAAQAQAQINRLKTMRSQGRVALELDPDRTAFAAGAAARPVGQDLATLLPHIPLEDGDAIHVPPMPAFVAATGSVNNENVFVHRQGRTVGDLLRAAGLTEDAEPSQAFLLRADGSIVSRQATGWLSSFESIKVHPGDTLVVPAMVERESRYNFVVRAMKDWTQIFSNLGLGAAAIKSLKD